MRFTEEKRKEATALLIDQMKRGNAPWQRPWDTAKFVPYNPTSNKEYQGCNFLMLTAREFNDPRWCTFNQAKIKGYHINKGAKASYVEYWQFNKEVKELDKNGIEQTVLMRLQKPMVKTAHVFNFEQITGVPKLDIDSIRHNWDPIATGERIISNSGVKIEHIASQKAYYNLIRDTITLPNKEQFADAKAYYSVALHELSHSTGHKSRLNRNVLIGGMIDKTLYAKEELRAEIGSYFVALKTGIPNDIKQNAAYVDSWIQALKNDPNEIYRASRDADIISSYLIGDNEVKKELISKQNVMNKNRDKEIGR